jgi:bacillithiol synthase
VRATLEALLGPFGMAFVDAGDPALKAASVGVLEAAADGAEAHERALSQRTAHLTENGWGVQVPVLENGVNLFVEGAEGRERLYRKDGAFGLRGGERLTLEDLRTRLRDDPRTVSPNVLLRPVVEAACLPTLGYVAGPAETAYHAELAPLFASHGVPQPIIFPRFSAAIVEKKVGKVLEKLNLDLASLARPMHEIAGELARSELPEGVTRSLAALRETIEREGSAVYEAAKGIDPTLKGPLDRAKSLSIDAWSDAEKKIVQALKRVGETHLQQVEKARLHLFPDGEPQERVLNVFYYLARYGPELLTELTETFYEQLPAAETARR